MRRDMQKVIVERPRHGEWGWCFGQRRLAFERGSRDRHDHEVMASFMPTRIFRSKGLNENLAPLRRFLLRRVGQRWDRVYAELRAHLSPKRAIDMHVLEHLYDYVLFARAEPGGVGLYTRNGYSRGNLGGSEGVRTDWRHMPLYVCHETGVLRRLPDVKKWRLRAAVASPPSG